MQKIKPKNQKKLKKTMQKTHFCKKEGKMNLKNYVANLLKTEEISVETIENLVSVPPQKQMGDLSLPCFSLAKILHKSPNDIAKNFQDVLKDDKMFSKIEVQNGYLNLFFDQKKYSKLVLDEILKQQDNFGQENLAKGKLACIEYSSINVAKNPHVGHLCGTVYGESFARLHENFGYTVKRLNYLGDYGTQFGKVINGFLKFGDKQKVEKNGVDELQNIYIKSNKMCEDDENYLEECRQTFLKLEQGDEVVKALYEWFVEISKNEAKAIYKQLGVEFDDWRGEAYYAQFNDETLKTLKEKNLVVRDQGALLVDLQNYNLGKLIVEQTSGASIYATRDLSCLIHRHEDYDYDKLLYVTGVEQELYFKQIFKVGELLNLPYMSKVFHFSTGRLSLPEGKISSRKGAVALLKDLFAISKQKAIQVLKEKGTSSEDLETLASQIGIGALIFSILKVTAQKDAVFDIQKAVSFDGETGPYLQYTFARTNSVLEKFEKMNLTEEPDFSLLGEDGFEIAKLLEKFPSVLKMALNDYEPSYIARFAISLASNFNKFYANCRIVSEDKNLTNANASLTKIVNTVLKKCLYFLVMSAPEKM